MKHPTHLDKKAWGKFDELYGLVEGSFKEGDENLLAVLANAYIHYSIANKAMKDRGPVLAGDTMVRKNPAFDIVKDCVKIIESLSGHFGFSPKSRNEKMGKLDTKKDKLDKLIDG